MSLVSKLSTKLKRSNALRFGKNEDGVTAIEFAIVGPVFFMILGSLMETGIFMFAEYVLQTSVQDAARLVRTGQAQEQQLDAAAFKDEVCDLASIVMDCDDITVYMTSAASFAALDAAVPSFMDVGDGYGGTSAPATYACGNPSQAVALIATYDWDFSVPFLAETFGNVDGDTKRRLAGVTVFQNEPFPASSNTCT